MLKIFTHTHKKLKKNLLLTDSYKNIFYHYNVVSASEEIFYRQGFGLPMVSHIDMPLPRIFRICPPQKCNIFLLH